MVVAYSCAESLPRADRGIRQPSRGFAFPARRHLEKFLLQVLRIESAAQENAACFGKSSEPRSKPPAGPGISRRSRTGEDAGVAQPVQRRLLAWSFRRALCSSFAHGAVARPGG